MYQNGCRMGITNPLFATDYDVLCKVVSTGSTTAVLCLVTVCPPLFLQANDDFFDFIAS